MSFNVNDYTIPELQQILNLNDDEMNEENIVETTKTYIINFYHEDKRLSQFFEKVQTETIVVRPIP
jgi:hypothetical protein